MSDERIREMVEAVAEDEALMRLIVRRLKARGYEDPEDLTDGIIAEEVVEPLAELATRIDAQVGERVLTEDIERVMSEEYERLREETGEDMVSAEEVSRRARARFEGELEQVVKALRGPQDGR